MRKACSDKIVDMALSDPRIVFVGSDLGAGAMAQFQTQSPERFFMEGISEQHIVGFAAGLAMEGFVPIVNTIATFLTRRAFEQIAMDIGLHNVPVILMGNGAGLVYAHLGPSHLAIDDIGLMRLVPGMTVLCPADSTEARLLLEQAIDNQTPTYIRIGPANPPDLPHQHVPPVIGVPVTLLDAEEVIIFSTGFASHQALAAAHLLRTQGIDAGVVHVHSVKPLYLDELMDRLTKARLIVTVEEHNRTGGLGSALLEGLSDAKVPCPVFLRLGLEDCYPDGYGDQAYLVEKYGLSAEKIAQAVRATYLSI
ncbi:1-deoxy-D-xylulose-5-phosphate synthase [Pseudomonas sp. 37 R 15]|uniref:transketolase family protein n=1 Tax=Pseudomonas sp. 37 R 15 TaxID=1844104 RepID=UPI0008127DFD|nr:transketolase C-terminal domain-containing protein [Pseudomonas sp. 37 R 15]CRM79498.1 1-deoxy-D-xylulose-5-phosphate synthase [Pseudomonas sp. 37 R 15]